MRLNRFDEVIAELKATLYSSVSAFQTMMNLFLNQNLFTINLSKNKDLKKMLTIY